MFVAQEEYSLGNLKNELITDSTNLGYAALITNADYAGIKNLLSTIVTTATFSVSTDIIIQWLTGNSRLTKLKTAATNTTTIIPGVGDVASISQIFLLAIDPNSGVRSVDFSDPQIQELIDALVSVNMFDQNDKTSSLTLGVQNMTRMQQLWGIDVVINEKDIVQVVAIPLSGYSILFQHKADDVVVAFLHAQEYERYCHILNKQRYESILQQPIVSDAFNQRIAQLLRETNQRIAEVESILAATTAQLPPQDRIDASRARLIANGSIT